MTRPIESAVGPTSDWQAWIADNCATTKPVKRMVERSGLNARAFSRRFRAAMGLAPIKYVQALRVEQAKQILETGALSIDEVEASNDYDDPASFRPVFKRNVGQSPTVYRKKFQGISQISRPVGT